MSIDIGEIDNKIARFSLSLIIFFCIVTLSGKARLKNVASRIKSARSVSYSEDVTRKLVEGRFHAVPYPALKIDAEGGLFNERPSIPSCYHRRSRRAVPGVKIEKPATMDAVDSTSD